MHEYVINSILSVLESAVIWIVLLILIGWGMREKMEWATSVRALITLVIGFTFCAMAFEGKILAKDFMLIVSIIFNFYFLVKQRKDTDMNNKS